MESEFRPSHLRPVTIKLVGRIFRKSAIQNPIRGKTRKNAEGFFSPQKTRVRWDPAEQKTWKMRKMRTRKNAEKMRKNAEKCGWLALMWLALGDLHFGTGRKFGTDVAKNAAERSQKMLFYFCRQKRQENGVQKSEKKKYGGSKNYYGFERRTIFSTEGSFGLYLQVAKTLRRGLRKCFFIFL